MSAIKIIQNQDVIKKLDTYPSNVRTKLKEVRNLILKTAEKTPGIAIVEESLKWGEPSYAVKGGSPVRFDWKPKHPDHFMLYFNCKTDLVASFRLTYGDFFSYEKNRAIILNLEGEFPEKEIQNCVRRAFLYQQVKLNPFLI